MIGVRIKDTDVNEDSLNFDLRDVLQAIGAPALDSRWRLRKVEAAPGKTFEAADELQRLSDENGEVNGRQLLHLAQHVMQIVDGEFIAKNAGGKTPWLLVRVFSASFFEVVTTKEEILAGLRKRFKDVADLTEDELSRDAPEFGGG